MPTLLAFDTATDQMCVGLLANGEMTVHESQGGAQASAALIPCITGLLARVGVKLRELDAIAFGRGPGAFTGLRTACSVAQGLALGADKPVIPIDSLLALAEDARDGDAPQSVWAVVDARMNEIYAAHYGYDGGRWRTLVAPMLTVPELLNEVWLDEPPRLIAGNALSAFADRLDVGKLGNARCVAGALPRARPMSSLALSAWHAGEAVDAALALPLYVRDKVAQTMAEREAARAETLASGGAATRHAASSQPPSTRKRGAVT